MALISGGDGGIPVVSKLAADGSVTTLMSGSEKWLLMEATLSVKKEANVSAVRLVAGGGGGGLSRVLKVENSFLVSMAL